MIKRIQLRGISSTPSDRNNQDGGCAESLNLYINQGELATIQAPVDAGILTSEYPVRYIHKTASYTNYVAVSGTVVRIYINGVARISKDIGAEPKSFSHIGNTLMVSTDDHLHYFLYQNGSYSYLGTRIYEPKVEFSAQSYSGTLSDAIRKDAYITKDDFKSSNQSIDDKALAHILVNTPEQAITASRWRQYLKNRSLVVSSSQDIKGEDIAYSLEYRIWEIITKMVSSNRANDIFSRPVLARAALKLYDGSYIYHTEPFLIGQGNNQWLNVHRLEHANESGEDDTIGEATYTRIKVSLNGLYTASYDITCDVDELTKWRDIIQSVDIFLSEDICNPHTSSMLEGVELTTNEFDFAFYFEGQTGISRLRDIKEEIINKGNFYRIASIPVSQLTATYHDTLQPKSQDNLVASPVLPLDTLSHHESYPIGSMTVYNERVVYSGLAQRIYAGSPTVQSSVDDGSVMHSYTTKYYLHSINGTIATNGESFVANKLFGSFIYYPDPRCYQVDIKVDDITYRIPMEEHPSLNGAYALCDLNKNITTIGSVITSPDFTYQPNMQDPTKFVMSEVANPFLLPTTGRLNFDSEVLKVCTITSALSTNRNGMFPYYVFTKTGVWSVEINDDGSLRSQPQAVSRDVALDADSITAIDNAIVFTTSRGVMLLNGSQVTNLSPNDSGDKYIIDSETEAMIVGTVWEKYLPILKDNTPFLEYIQDAATLYDYAGDRLILISETHSTYQYIYCLGEGTWHKMARLDGLSYVCALNSYPQALASVKRLDTYYIYDFTHPTHVTDGQRLTGLTITRGLDFDAPFVRKTINKLYVRGYRDRLADDGSLTANYILLASKDGIAYAPLYSLKGKSYNFFRLILLTNLLPGERITYVEVDTKERFLNKIR